MSHTGHQCTQSISTDLPRTSLNKSVETAVSCLLRYGYCLCIYTHLSHYLPFCMRGGGAVLLYFRPILKCRLSTWKVRSLNLVKVLTKTDDKLAKADDNMTNKINTCSYLVWRSAWLGYSKDRLAQYQDNVVGGGGFQVMVLVAWCPSRAAL